MMLKQYRMLMLLLFTFVGVTVHKAYGMNLRTAGGNHIIGHIANIVNRIIARVAALLHGKGEAEWMRFSQRLVTLLLGFHDVILGDHRFEIVSNGKLCDGILGLDTRTPCCNRQGMRSGKLIKLGKRGYHPLPFNVTAVAAEDGLLAVDLPEQAASEVQLLKNSLGEIPGLHIPLIQQKG